MRRIIASVLFIVLLTQSSGASALAANRSSGNAIAAVGGIFAAAVMTPLRNAWMNSATHAMLTVQMSRYEAMHAPAPSFPRVIRIAQPPYAGRRHEARPVRRYGSVARVPGLHRPEAIDPRKAPRDPMAMRRSTAPGTATQPRSQGFVFTPRWNVHGRFALTGVHPMIENTASPAPGSHVSPMYCGLHGCITPPPTATPSPTPSPTPTPTPTPIPTPTPTASPTTTPSPSGLSLSTTGINHYWTYEEEPLPGIGKAMVNVGNGNMVVQVDDLDIPERGIDLAFQRTYNSQSQHDASDTDGSTPSVFGNGWTNTFDAHLAYNATYNVISVYDIDGARYDFCANGQGQWNACTSAGTNNYTALTSDGGCGYYWTKKTGTAYYFEAPNQPSTCGTQIAAGLSGRILEIQGRNINNALTFTYSWVNGDDTNPENLAQIVVSHSDGQSVTLTFGLLNGTGPDELASISRPDGSTISYEYDSTGDLTEVDRPGNSTTASQTCSNTNTYCIPEAYTYTSGYLLWTANSPRYTVSYRANNDNPLEGDTVYFAYDGGRRISSLTDYGVMNFVPNDGSNALLQPSEPSGFQSWFTETFSGYTSTPPQPCQNQLDWSNATTVSDSDGHSRIWTYDACWRAIQVQAYTGAQWLVTSATWDANDDLTSSTDARGNATTLAYDVDGNLTMVATPQVTTSLGTFQPTARYEYDQYNNLLYYCDPNWVHQNGGDYPAGTNPCTGSPASVTHYAYNYSVQQEPYGELSGFTTAAGYQVAVTVDADDEPTSIQGASISQPDNSNRTPSVAASYDSLGNVISMNAGQGASTIAYDNLNRPLMQTNADSVSSYVCYYADGQPFYTETSLQHALDGGARGVPNCQSAAPADADSQTYDADGDVLSGTHHFDNIAATLLAWYDGDDRLIEVQEPRDSRYDLLSYPWSTRYIYDLSQNGLLEWNGNVAVHAHGALWAIERYLDGGVEDTYSLPNGTPAWVNVEGYSLDALDRQTERITFVPSTDTYNETTDNYDTVNLGLLDSRTNAVGDTTQYTYDNQSRVTSISFTNGSVSYATPAESMMFDANGRVTSITSAAFGTESYAYDRNELLTGVTTPSGGAGLSWMHQSSSALPVATMTLTRYADGSLESETVSVPNNQSVTPTYSYAYRQDGLLSWEQASFLSAAITWSYSGAGRELTESDSGGTDSWTYDQNGNVSASSFPSAALSSFAYDAEGELLQYSLRCTGCASPQTVSYGYTNRGELATDPQNDAISYADGIPVNLSLQPSCYDQVQECFTAYPEIDLLAGVISGDDFVGSGVDDFKVSNAFDAAGRLMSVAGLQQDPTTGVVEPGGSDVGNYDVEDRNVEPGNGFVGYGPDGRPLLTDYVTGSGPCPQSCVYHKQVEYWDTSTPVLTIDLSGDVEEANIGQLATEDFNNTNVGMAFWDRDPSGAIVAAHSAAGYGPVIIGSPFGTPISYQNPALRADPPHEWSWAGGTWPTKGYTYESVWKNWLPLWSRPDQVVVYGLAVQGARTYNGNVAGWSTPDESDPLLDDSMPQTPYMWDNNNPMSYEDPTGYAGFERCTYAQDPIGSPGDHGTDLPTIAHVTCTLANGSLPLLPAPRPGPNMHVGVHYDRRQPSCSESATATAEAPPPPPGHSWSQAYAAGNYGALNPFAAWNNLVGNGPLNYQANGHPELREDSNFVVGLYGRSAGFTKGMLHAAISFVASLHHNNPLSVWQDGIWADWGYDWATKYCH